MNILVINCGSSSLKYQLINSETEDVLAKGLCERIGIDGILTYQPADGEKEKSEKAMPTHTEAIKFVLEALTNEKTGVIKSLSEVGAVGHREPVTLTFILKLCWVYITAVSMRSKSAAIWLLFTIRPTSSACAHARS